MKEIGSDELKRIQIDLLKKVHNYCVNNGITYWLAYGSLIGAIRHNGYIPWDDDVDIAMPREDYEKFCTAYKDSASEVCHCKYVPDYNVHFAKVFDTRTVLKEYSNFGKETGIYIDIFPIDNIPDDDETTERLCKRIRRYRNLWNLKRNHLFGYRRSVVKTIAFAFCKIISPFYSSHWIANRLNSLMATYRYSETQRCACLTAGKPRVITKPYSVEYHKFEQELFFVPSNYHEWLTKEYGDYMTPPQDKTSTHIFKAWWK